MARIDASKVKVLVFTYKEGLLSAVAHDLELEVKRCAIDEEADRITGEFEASSVKVVTAMKDGAPQPGSLSDSMKADIEKNMLGDVLDVRRHPTVRFESTKVSPTAVEGRLTLHGVTKTVTGTRKDADGARVAEFRLDQRDFGIKPFSAMLGTLKIKPEVLVRVSITS
jgi:polyisoprenoid-binding protein YceI